MDSDNPKKEASSLEQLAMISHEIRTPMNAILGLSSLLLKTKLNAEQFDFTETIKHSAEALVHIINDFLDFSKIQAGNLTLEKVPMDLREICFKIADLFSLPAKDKGLKFEFSYPETAASFFLGDPTRLRQILSNLISNAIKFTKKGSVSLIVKHDPIVEGQARLTFEIKDTGIGIPKGKQSHIFDKFTQAESSTTREFGGTGLGLAICKNLVDLMGGELSLESETQVGTTFRVEVEFPIDKAKEKGNRKSSHLWLVGALDQMGPAFQAYGKGVFSQITEVENWQLTKQAKENHHLIFVSKTGLREQTQTLLNLREIPAKNRIALVAKRQTGDASIAKMTGFQQIRDLPIGLNDLYALVQGSTKMESEISPKDQPMDSVKTLLVEDNRVNQKVASRLLKNLNCEVSIASDGQEALKILKEEKFHLIFMDCQMPVLDGYETTRSIRLDPKLKENIIIAMTANAIAGDREKCLEAGMDDYLAKPIRESDVFAMIQKWRNDTQKPEKKHVLLVDDSVTVQKLGKMLLEQAGYRVSTAGDGYPALEILKQGPVDAIICDLFMPEMDGFEFLQKTGEIQGELPVIAITGKEIQNLRAAKQLGATEILFKKTLKETLVPTLQHMLENHIKQQEMIATTV